MHQGRLFRLGIVALQPANLGLHCHDIGTGEDSLKYYIKRCGCGRHLVPASEFIGTRLAAACGLVVPPCYVGVLSSGEHVFASRSLDGALSEAEFLGVLISPHPPKSLAAHLSRWLAFDAFVGNPDRALRNLLLFQGSAGLGLAGIDFGECSFSRAWPPGPLSLEDATLQTRDLFRDSLPLEVMPALDLLDRIALLPDDWMQNCLEELPSEWDEFNRFSSVQDWWVRNRKRRVDRIKQDFIDGKYV
jgi:hypothetical protein